MSSAPRSTAGRSLTADELGSAAAMSAIAVGLEVIGSFVPYARGVHILVVVPFAIVAHRHRRRAVFAALVAAASVATLVVGLGGAFGLAAYALLGGVVGDVRRREQGFGRLVASALVLAPALAAVADLLLLVFSAYRKLVLQSLQATIKGLAKALGHFPALGGAARWLRHATANVIVDHWALAVAGVIFVLVPTMMMLAWYVLEEVLDRLRWVGDHGLQIIPDDAQQAAQQPDPVPVTMTEVSVRYGDNAALDGIDLRFPAGQFIAVIGDNGSGKSTLARLLAGAQPSEGSVTRPGAVGLGRPGGTALIAQRPDAQVLGLTAADDVVWGLAEPHGVDIDGLLETVGLAGMGDQETSSLSGGQLQRLAVAAALARSPRLLISDESTAMVDPAGRAALVELLAALPRERAMTVVHITHNEAEVASADRVLHLRAGRLVGDSDALASMPAAALPVAATPLPAPVALAGEASGSALQEPVTLAGDTSGTARGAAGKAGEAREALVLDGVGHSYAYRTVWEQRALQDITLSISAGEGVMIVGDNGSGKSTLAWIIAGLLRPTEGLCLLGAQPVRRRRRDVAIAFQHARLQLQRPTVGADIADAAGWHGYREYHAPGSPERLALDRKVAQALELVGLSAELAQRSVEQLSGGQQRRVAIAGLLARDPRVLVVDEPLAGLDAPTRSGLVQLLSELRARSGVTLVAVTHDPEALAQVCPRTIQLADGRIVSDSSAAQARLESSAA